MSAQYKEHLEKLAKEHIAALSAVENWIEKSLICEKLQDVIDAIVNAESEQEDR